MYLAENGKHHLHSPVTLKKQLQQIGFDKMLPKWKISSMSLFTMKCHCQDQLPIHEGN